jgi:phosphoglycolate phosphatase-like HAD superfamily hydrolase
MFLGALGCGKEEPAKKPETVAKAALPKLQLSTRELQEITLNGKGVDELAVLAPETSTLDRDDLAKAIGIENDKYLEEVMKLLDAQIKSGTPLNLISIFFGPVSTQYAAQCMESLPADQCLIAPVAFNCSDALPPKNWNLEAYHMVCRSLGRLKVYKPELLVALFDGDNTLWYQDVSNAGVKKGVAAKRLNWGPTKAELLNIYPPPEQRDGYKASKTPYDYYQDLYKKVGPLWNYNYAALAFRGLPLKETFVNFQEMVVEPYGPQPFSEMADLLRYLQQQGIVTGVVSASPVFGVIPMVERLGAEIPLERIEGLDVFVKNPNDPNALPVRLSRLINQGKLEVGINQITPFKNYQEILESYGDWIIVDVDQVINARGGKGVQGRSIVRRYVADKNRKAQKPEEIIDLEQMKLVLIAGDNFAPATDIPRTEGDRIKAALEEGNDQGMSESLGFFPASKTVPGGTDFLFIRRYEMDEKNQVWPRHGMLKNFQEYIDQQKLLRPNEVGMVMTQEALTELNIAGAKGGFLKERPTTTETQPTPGTQPSVPGAVPPGAPTQIPGVPLPPVPTPHPMPPEQVFPPTTPTEPGAPPPTAPAPPASGVAPGTTPPGPPPLPGTAPTPGLPGTSTTPGAPPTAPERPPPALTPPTPTTPGQLAPLPPAPSANDALQ